MAISFPSNPNHGDVYTQNSYLWVYNSTSTAWLAGPLPFGATGATGPAGVDGAAGADGSPGGATGPAGATGLTGATGAIGLTGASGDGATGATGQQGDLGATGQQGDSGATGPQGIPGTAAAQGGTGATGPSGTGATGASGSNGLVGATGAQGATGIQGATGAQGIQGTEGTRDYTVTNNGSSNYIIDGVSQPTLNLIRGFSYVFNLAVTGHPFYIKTAAGTGTGSQYNDGVTNNGAQTGAVLIRLPYTAPSTLYYQCSIHGSMVGVINVSDLGPQGIQGTTGVQGSTGSNGSVGATGSNGSVGATGSAVLVGNTYTVQTLYVNTLTVSAAGVANIVSGNDLNLTAAGSVRVRSPFALSTCTTSTLSTLALTCTQGTFMFAIDAVGAAQPVYYDGTYWWTFDRIRIY